MIQQRMTRLHAFINEEFRGLDFVTVVIEKAELLQITGWVRNTYDGQVEVTAEGIRPVLERLAGLPQPWSPGRLRV